MSAASQNSQQQAAPVLVARGISKSFRRETGEPVQALANFDLEIAPGMLAALVGPDGAGKTTFMRLAAGLMFAESGQLEVLGFDVSTEPQEVQDRIGYMPQRFGLYEDLTVQENLDLYADLHGVTRDERRTRYAQLMEMTNLGRFTKRLAGQLSGGMKQKLGLACTLIREPALLLLDEPTVGVDPLSRRELWEIILQLVQENGQTVLTSTTYLDEAERCHKVAVMHAGTILAQGPPAEISRIAAGRSFLAEPPAGEPARELQAALLGDARVIDALPEGGEVRLVVAEASAPSGDSEKEDSETLRRAHVRPVEPRFEDGFMILLRKAVPAHSFVAGAMTLAHAIPGDSREAVVEVHDLVRRFGSFTAVDQVSFEVHRGEIFGLLGPNGAGKTTTFRMLCGLLPASGGTLRVAGVDLRHARASARERIGYVAQKFSLYGQLTVVENLDFYGSAYGLRGRKKRDRIDWALEQFELKSLSRLASGQLPGGFKQRLSMAAALLHEPDTLFLDEPTSGVDPLARREFWQRITALARQGVTVIVTTHFMEEAEYCDRIAILDAGQVLAQGTPAEVRRHAQPEADRTANMEDAFIAIVEEARSANRHAANQNGNGMDRQGGAA